MSKIITIACLLIYGNFLFGQQDFNNYKTLRSQGIIPADFSTVTSEKVKSDLQTGETGLKGEKERIFLEGIHYSIDGILHSNLVVYGDEVSQYVADVAGNLLKDQPELKNSFRFYTLKSNQANAMSTEQGIIFVTTGLISQLTSEAQLAYILAHEISHYTEHHVVETFEYKSDRKNLYIDKLSVYSKEKEFEADRLALDLYSKAGYNRSEIEKTFDVLMYSYLPFDEVALPHDYFNTPYMYVPESAFPDKKYEIKAEEDVDDSKSSHPNIKKRKDAVNTAMANIQNWQESTSLLTEERFVYIRNIARFESVRNAVIDAHFVEGLYTIFLLEKDYPQSVYLKRMKAQCWLGIAQFKANNSKLSGDDKLDEGEIAVLYNTLKSSDEMSLLTLALRANYDLAKELPEDEEISIIYDRTIETVASKKKFKLEEFSTKKFHEAASAVLVKDTSAVITPPEPAASSKYDKIKNKKSPESNESFDTLKFWVYGISDIISDEAFVAKFKGYKQKTEEAEAEEDAFSNLSKSDRKKALKKAREESMYLGLKSVIVVEPSVIEYSRKRIDHQRSEELAVKLEETLVDVAYMLDVPLDKVSSQTLEEKGTQDFNDRSVLYSSVEQSVNFGDLDFFPVDYQLLGEIRKRREKSTALFIVAEHKYAPEVSWGAVGYSVLFFPVLPFTMVGYVFPKLLTGHQSEFSMLVIDMEKGQVISGMSVLFHEQMNKHNMGAHFYTVLKQLITPPSE